MLGRTISERNSFLSRVEDHKRKRDVLSCLDCRRRKLKCDRGYPACGRCHRGGNAASCTYSGVINTLENGEIDSNSPDAAPNIAKRVKLGNPHNSYAGDLDSLTQSSTLLTQAKDIRRLEERLRELERLVISKQLGSRDEYNNTESDEAKELESTLKERETNLFKGRGFRTQFYGASCPTSLLAHFPEVRTFMTESYPNSDLERVQHEARQLEKKSRPLLPLAPTTDLLSLLPTQPKVDGLVRIYMETFGRTYHILHLPSFWKDYSAFWTKDENISPGFIPLLLMIIATVHCSTNEPLTYDHDGSSPRNAAVSWILACDTWLAGQSQKHRFMAMYQIMCLRVLAASANCLKTKTMYVGVQALLTYFKAAGMHRDPSLLDSKCSMFDREMRRRLWHVVQEMELQASIDRGTASNLHGLMGDCSAPANLNDDDLAIDCVTIPAAHSSKVYTDTSFLCESSKTLQLRITLCSVVNNSTTQLPFTDVLHYEQQINVAISSIPKWTNPESAHASALLELQLLQFLVLLHSPNARRTGFTSQYSQLACFSSAKKILEHHSALTTNGMVTLALVREDIFRAALTICQNAFSCITIPPDFMFTGIIAMVPEILKTAFELLEERCMRRGRGLHQYWYVSAAAALVQGKLEPEMVDLVKSQATQRVAKLYHRYLALWETASASKQTVPSSVLTAEGISNESWNQESAIKTVASETMNHYDEPGASFEMGIDLFDSSDWTLDNLWPIDGGFEIML